MSSALLMLVAAVGGSFHQDTVLAAQHRQQYPPEQWYRYRYFSAACVEPGTARQDLVTAFKYTMPGLSTSPVFDACMPVKISDTLYQIDVETLGWPKPIVDQVFGAYKYDIRPSVLTMRMDWFVTEASDCKRSDAYYLLVFGEVPKTRDRALQILGADFDESKRRGYIETNSGVSQSGTRRVENWPISRGQLWRTRDVLKLTLESDPIEQLEGDFKHDGEEIIAGIEKHDTNTRTVGLWPVYFLSNGQGNVVDFAPVDLVEDHTRFRGNAEIVAPGSCIQCHTLGLKFPSIDGFQQLVDAGVQWKPKADIDPEAIKRFYFVNFNTAIRRYNEDFDALCRIACDCDTTAASAAFMRALNRYDAPVTPERVAWDCGIDVKELSAALGWARSVGAALPARVSGAAGGLSVPRDAYEDGGCLAIQNIVENYQRRN